MGTLSHFFLPPSGRGSIFSSTARGRVRAASSTRLNNNSLSGTIPKSFTNITALWVVDLSNNNLSGEVPSTGSFSLFTPISSANNPLLCGPGTTKACPGAPLSPPPPFVPPTPPSSQALTESWG